MDNNFQNSSLNLGAVNQNMNIIGGDLNFIPQQMTMQTPNIDNTQNVIVDNNVQNSVINQGISLNNQYAQTSADLNANININANTINSNIATDNTSVQSAVNQANTTVTTESNEKLSHQVVNNVKHQVCDTFKLNIANLKIMMDSVNKAIVADTRIPVSLCTQLKFSSKGLEVKGAEDGFHTVIAMLDDTYSYVNELNIGIETKKFKSLLDKIPTTNSDGSDNEMELQYDSSLRVIKLILPNGLYQFPEKYDSNTGESLDIPIPEDMLNIPYVTVNDFSDFQKKLKEMLVFACKTQAYAECNGVYFDPETITSNDRHNFAVIDTIPELKGKEVYLPNKFVEAVKDLYVSGTVKFGMKMDEGATHVNRVILYNDNFMVTGPAMIDTFYEDYPLASIKKFSNVKMSNELMINKQVFIESLERTQIFINPETDRDLIQITFKGNYLEIISLGGSSREVVPLEGAPLTTLPKKLQAKNLLDALRTLDCELVKFTIDPEVGYMIGLNSDVFSIILSTDES